MIWLRGLFVEPDSSAFAVPDPESRTYQKRQEQLELSAVWLRQDVMLVHGFIEESHIADAISSETFIPRLHHPAIH
jgi:hypothetical protein